MSDVTLVPLDAADPQLVATLLDDELLAWESELGWDYRKVQGILLSFIERGALPGYVAVEGQRPLGYAYFLAHASKGVIGTVYRNGSGVSDEVVDRLLGAAVMVLQENTLIRRIEAQVLPFHGISLSDGFRQRDFDYFPRQFLERDLAQFPPCRSHAVEEMIVPWNNTLLEEAARVAWFGYRNQVDSRVCEDYRTEEGCEGYLRSLVETPGCGTFLPAASRVALDSRGAVCGFILVSRISQTGAMIPQISVLPPHQGRGLGGALMERALAALAAEGWRSVGLTVTVENRRALEWYERQGFRLRKEFGAFVWQRP